MSTIIHGGVLNGLAAVMELSGSKKMRQEILPRLIRYVCVQAWQQFEI